MKSLLATIRIFARTTRATAAIEFAILLPIVLLLAVGTLDLGMGFKEKTELQSAVNSGLQHAMQSEGRDIATTRRVIAYGAAPGTEIAVEAICRCSNGVIACNASCPSGLQRFVSASATHPYSTMMFGIDLTLSANFEVYVGR